MVIRPHATVKAAAFGREPANSPYRLRVLSAAESHENRLALALLRSDRYFRLRRPSTRLCMASAISSVRSGSTRTAASPATSGMEVLLELITGAPRLIASR